MDKSRLSTICFSCALFASVGGCGLTWFGNSVKLKEPVLMIPEEKQAYAKKHGLRLEALDLNRDGTPDIYNYYVREADQTVPPLVRKELDLNHDGHADVIRTYEAGGILEKEEVDLDFDGTIDEVSHYQQNQLRTRSMDLNGDKIPDLSKFYTQGQLDRIESDRNVDGKVDTWEYFEKGTLVRTGYDTDGDGKVDAWERVPVVPVEETSPPAAE